MSVARFIHRLNGIEVINPIKEEGYVMPTRVIFGRGVLREIKNLPPVKESQKILLVAGEHFKNSEDFSQFRGKLTEAGIETTVYDEKISKSDFIAINKLVNFCRKVKPDGVIGIGGGTILDTAKCAAILTTNEGKIEDYVRDKTRELKVKGATFVAVPTTAGTGSEVTPWATVWDEKKKDKYSLASPLMFPDLAIIDPSLTDSLPAKTTAESGIDALAQAIEAYWSVKHNPISDEFALEAIKLALESLEKAVNKPDKESRDRMAKASLFAGLAFSNTQTTICHAVSYPITAYFGVPHGQAVAITLPLFLEYTLPVLEEARRKVLLEVLGVKNEKEVRIRVERLMEKMHLSTRFSHLGISHKDIDLIVRKGFHPDRAKNAPWIPTSEELGEMLRSIF